MITNDNDERIKSIKYIYYDFIICYNELKQTKIFF